LNDPAEVARAEPRLSRRYDKQRRAEGDQHMCPETRRFPHRFAFSAEQAAKQTSGNKSDDDDRHCTRIGHAEQFVGKKIHVYTLPKKTTRSVRF
jgi:hypothetical protein